MKSSKTLKNEAYSLLKEKCLSQSKELAKLHLNGDLSLAELWNGLTVIKNKLEQVELELLSEEDYKQSLKDCKL